ncbi:MAG: dihydrolipoyl dehydrogenase family protein [Fervidobacterium sp.]
MEKFDLIVIGSGSGLDVAVAAAEYGLKVAIIEKGPLGGTCLNRGCIPSKMLIYSADVMECIQRAQPFGIEVNEYKINFKSIVDRVSKEVDFDSQRIESSLERIKNPLLFKEKCKFIAYKTLKVGEKIIWANKILIASGSRPKIPNIDGLKESGFITSDEALRLKVQPKALTIIGGGYIAVELAHFFGALGTKINIVQKHSTLIPNEDEELSKRFSEIFNMKYNVHLDSFPINVSKKDGEFKVTIKNIKENQIKVLYSDQLLVAAGRIPNSDMLDVGKTDVKVNDAGNVLTDEFLETNVKGIFALGDVVGRYPFKHNANLEAGYALHNIINYKNKKAVDYTAIPHAIFSSPQIASVGYTEQQLKAKNIHYLVGRASYTDTAMGSAIEDRNGFVKLLIDGHSNTILGCHILGTNASILIHEILVAMRTGSASINSIRQTVHIHPSLSEVVQKAALYLH